MRNLIFALVVIGLIGLYLWHFDPSTIKKNLQKKTLGNPSGNAPCVCSCYLNGGDILIGPKRVQHITLNPAQVVVKYALATDLKNNTALSETIPGGQIPTVSGKKKRKELRRERKEFKKFLHSNPLYTATMDNLSSNSATVHLTRQAKKEKVEQWAILQKSPTGWLVKEMSYDEL